MTAVDARVGAGYARRRMVDDELHIEAEWLRDFEAAARRPLAHRIDYSFIRTPKPVMDDEPFRAFATTADYRRWCRENLPSWLGYD
jgi:hypothetical protein